MNDDFARLVAAELARPDAVIQVNAHGHASLTNSSAPIEKPKPATTPEVEAMTKQLAACEAALTQVMDAMMAIRFGLLCSGYPVDVSDALKHPYVQHVLGQHQNQQRIEMNDNMLKDLWEKKIADKQEVKRQRPHVFKPWTK